MRSKNVVRELINNNKLINVLVAGSNRYNENRHKFFMIASINPENNNIGLTFIPPDFKIVFDEKKNIVYRLDEVDLDDFIKLRDSLKRNLKLYIPFYIELYSPDIIKIADLIEGTELFILNQIEGDIKIKYGLNYFDGEKTVKYINYVKENSIYIKFDRVQDILLTLYHNKEEKKNFINIKLITEMFRRIKTNLLPQEILDIGEIIYKNGNIFTTILPGSQDNGFYIMDEIAYSIYENEFITPIIMKKKSDQTVRIKILNGTFVPGLARKMRNNLVRDGLSVIEFGTSPFPKMKESIMISQKGNYSTVKKVSEIVGINRIYYIVDSSVLNNIMIIIGEDLVE